jgi:hypothetical protein
MVRSNVLRQSNALNELSRSMKIPTLIWILLGGGILYYLYTQMTTANAASTLAESEYETQLLEAQQQQGAVLYPTPNGINANLGALTVPFANAGNALIGALNNAFSNNVVVPSVNAIQGSSYTTGSDGGTPIYNNDGSILGDISDN